MVPTLSANCPDRTQRPGHSAGGPGFFLFAAVNFEYAQLDVCSVLSIMQSYG